MPSKLQIASIVATLTKPKISPLPPPSPQLPQFLEVYKNILLAANIIGSSNVTVRQIRVNPENSNRDGNGEIATDSTARTTSEDPGPGYLYWATPNWPNLFYATKLISLLHLIYFVVQFYNWATCNPSDAGCYCPSNRVPEHVFIVYLIQLVFIFVLYAWAHVKRDRLCSFLNKINHLDHVIFGEEDHEGRQKYMAHHQRSYNRLKFYLPTIILISIVLIGFNHANHPRFPVHITSLVIRHKEDSYFSSPRNAIVTVFSFLIQFFLIFYYYLALYQFLFLTITLAKSLKLCLRALISRSSPEKLRAFLREYNRNMNHSYHDPQKRLLSLVEATIDKYEHIRSLMLEYNRMTSGLLLFFKAIFMINITIMTYIPLQTQRFHTLPLSSVYIFLVMVLHYLVQVIKLFSEMGDVHKISGQFREFWLVNLRKIGFGKQQGTGDEDNEEAGNMIEEAESINNNKGLGMEMKMRIDTCTPFGFECGGCYIVNSSTVLTFFSMCTSYLIIMLELGI